METKLFFNNGRSALKAGLKILNLKKKDEVLVPEFICDSVIQPFKDLNITPIFFNVKNNLNPNWKDVSKKFNQNTKAIMMIHFFGFPNEIEKFYKFKKNKKIYLIEDYCHGKNGKYKNSFLGNFGDISFSSIKKIIPIVKSGGILQINLKTINSNYKFINNLQKVNSYNFINKLFHQLKVIKKFYLKKFKYEIFRKKYEIYNSIEYAKKTKFFIGDNMSLNIIKKFNFDKEKKRRFNSYKKLEKIFNKKNIKPFFKINKDIMPWYFVGKTNLGIVGRKKLFKWCWKNNIDCFSWPKFPKEIENRLQNKKNWNSIICVSLKESQ